MKKFFIANAVVRTIQPSSQIRSCVLQQLAGCCVCLRPTNERTCRTMESTKKWLHQAVLLETKLQIFQELHGSVLAKTKVTKKFGIPKSTLLQIAKNKEAFECAIKNRVFTSKQMQTMPYEELEKVFCGLNMHKPQLIVFSARLDK